MRTFYFKIRYYTLLLLFTLLTIIKTQAQNNATISSNCGSSNLSITGYLTSNNRINIQIIKDNNIVGTIGDLVGPSVNQSYPLSGNGSYYVRFQEVNNDGNNITSTIANVNCSTSPPPPPPTGNCSYTEGQYLLTFYGEAIYAHYYNGILFAAYQDGSSFKPQHWLTATGQMSSSTASCFAENDPHSSSPPPTNPPPTGNCSVSSPLGTFDEGDCNGVRGWAFDQSDYSKTVTVDIYVDGNKVASVQANGDRPDLANYFGNSGARYHGFSYQFPANDSWKNGQNHNITTRICGVNNDIGGSPKAANGCTGGSTDIGARLSPNGVGRLLPPGDPNLDPDWKWTDPTYTLWYNTGSIHPQNPSNPFLFNSSGRLYNDMNSADGWMLVARDFGTATSAIPLPFYILYNKFRGILRAVIYYPDDQPAVTQHVISLKFADNNPNHPAIFNFAEKTADNSYLNKYSSNSIQKVTTEASAGSFMIADFNAVGYDPSLFEPSNHAYDNLGFSFSVYHNDVTNSNSYSQLTLNGTVQPQSLGDFSDQLGAVSGFFATSVDDIKKLVGKGGANVFEVINAGNEAINGLFGGGGGYNLSLKGEISTQATFSTLRFGGTIDLYVKPTSNGGPNYSPLRSIKYGLLNVNQFAPITVHKNLVNGDCYDLAGRKVQCVQYSANGFGIEPIINPDLELHIQGAYASYFGDQQFNLINANGPCPNSDPFGSQNVGPFRCNRYTNTRSYQSNPNTDDVFSAVGVLFVFYHYGYGIPTNGGDDPNPVVVYKEFRLDRNFVDGGRLKAQDEEILGLLPYPNPFEQEVNIPVQLSDYSKGYNIEIVSLEGKRVWSTSGMLTAPTIIKWSGEGYSNSQAKPSIYVCRISQNGIVISTRKIVMVK